MITPELLKKFKSLYKDEYNIILTDEEATDLATQFLNLMKVLIAPDQPKKKEPKSLEILPTSMQQNI